MKNFLKKILGFIIILFISNLVLGLIMPTRKFYGNEMYEQKYSSIKNNINDYDLYYFGSSRIVNGIIPRVFDSVMQVNNIEVNSYNMGSYGTMFNENIFLINSFMDDTSIRDATFIIEFQQVMSVPWSKMDRHKNIYYQNPDNFFFILNYVFDKDIRTFHDVLIGMHYIFSYSLGEALNIFNLGKIKGLLPVQHETINLDDKGFFARDDSQKIKQSIISNYQSEAKQLFQSNKNKSNETIIKKVHEIIKKAQERNISLIFILIPKPSTEEMVSTYKALPSTNKINHQNFLNQNSFFDSKNWGDNNHFNIQGAQIYTKFVAKEFLTVNGKNSSKKYN